MTSFKRYCLDFLARIPHNADMAKRKNTVTILGLDPGTRITGYGLIEISGHTLQALDYGCIRPPATLPLNERYLILFESLENILIKHSIDAVAIENQFVSRNAQSALKLAVAKGVLALATTKKKIPLFEYTPKKAKLAVVGNGGASKEQVQKMVQSLLSLKELPKEDASDALALAICHSHHIKKIKVLDV